MKDLFWSDAVVYEPFSTLEQGLKGWTQIEPFLRVAMMASESLSSKVSFEGSRKIIYSDLPDLKTDNSNDYDIVETLVAFQNGNIVEAKFRFELSSHANVIDYSDRKKIRALHIQFM